MPEPTRHTGDALRAALSTAGGLGLAPFAPGTFGTLGGVIVLLLIGALAPSHRLLLTGVAFVIACGAGFLLAPWAMKRWNREDPSCFVLDEVAGYLLTALLFPLGAAALHAGAAFVAFRVFDILKPWPVNRLERIPGGPGIMADDLGAAIYAALLLYALYLVGAPLDAAPAG